MPSLRAPPYTLCICYPLWPKPCTWVPTSHSITATQISANVCFSEKPSMITLSKNNKPPPGEAWLRG